MRIEIGDLAFLIIIGLIIALTFGTRKTPPKGIPLAQGRVGSVIYLTESRTITDNPLGASIVFPGDMILLECNGREQWFRRGPDGYTNRVGQTVEQWAK